MENMMKRRDFLKLSAAAAAGGLISSQASAQAANWPSRPVKLVVPYAPGGASDIIARPWAEALSQELGQQFVVENRGGAGGMIGSEAVMKAAPDGTTFLLTPCAALTILPLMQKTPYDPQKSFVPVGRIGDTISGFVIHPAVGPKTFKEMVDYAKANPGKLSYGSAGNATITHFRLEMLKYRAGIDILHVPYRGSADALNDLLANQIQMMAEINPLPHVKAGKLVLLSINHPRRSPEFPDTPTLTECGYPNSDMISWYAIYAPAGTPAEIIQKFNAAIAKIGGGADMKKKLQTISAVEVIDKPEETSKFLAEEIQRNAELIKAANIKLE
jgi:tripartite-type tricarboxylate transporter receptor subunit TctC